MRWVVFCLLGSFMISCSNPEQPTFKSIQNVRFNSVSFIKPYSVTLNVDAIYHNSNRLGADIVEMDFDVFVNGKKATHIKQDVKATMPGRSDFTLPIQVKIPLEEVIKDLKIKDLLNSKVIQYEMKGYLKMGLGDAVVKVPFNYSGEEKIGL